MENWYPIGMIIHFIGGIIFFIIHRYLINTGKTEERGDDFDLYLFVLILPVIYPVFWFLIGFFGSGVLIAYLFGGFLFAVDWLIRVLLRKGEANE